MSPRKAGKRGTPDRVVQLLQEEVKRTSQAATARATGLTLKGVQNYLKGIGEPTTATLEKLGAYFGVSVAELRGEYSLDAGIKKIVDAGYSLEDIFISRDAGNIRTLIPASDLVAIGMIFVNLAYNFDGSKEAISTVERGFQETRRILEKETHEKVIEHPEDEKFFVTPPPSPGPQSEDEV